ncbi:MAG TPA: aminotransferase class V-fold PLP-dependent enzyme [Candidatus Saccharimonadia bacterium]|nr:aminotransferase class V-fold PLP-dependent enzyme [Candidatus Saccharimonadia bacterium]
MVSPFLPDADKVAAIREAMPATTAGIYLNAGTAGPLTAETVAAMRAIEDWELRVGRADPDGYIDFAERLDECRGVLAAMLTADLDGIGLTHGATEALNHALFAIDWRPGDRIVTTDAEHPGLTGPIWSIRARAGVEVDVVAVDAAFDGQRFLERIRAAMTPRTRMIAVSHVLWTTGAVLPVEAIADIAERHGTWLVVDAAQSVGAIVVDAGRLRADVVALSGHKWLAGPIGTGAIWASARARAEALQSWAGHPSFASFDLPLAGETWPTGRRFELTDVHRPSIVGLARAVGWLQMAVGLPWAFERAGRLARQTATRLSAIDGVTLMTPLDAMATLVTIRVAGWRCEELREALAQQVFAITRTIEPLDGVRLSIGFWNTELELDRVVEAVATIAAHTPKTLPRRRELVILSADQA